ncbi:MAG TPA: hypothetical protein VF355_04725 [Anaerolineaceae bacterium]
MNTIRSLLIGVAVLLLASCNLGSSAVPQSAPLTPGSQVESGTLTPGDTANARPTLPAVEALSTLMPSFAGLYWTSDLLVERHGDSSLRVLAGMPCRQVLSLLSSGEWLLTKQIPANEQAQGMIPALALLERSGESLFLKLKDIAAVTPATPAADQGTPTSTPDPGAATTPGTDQLNDQAGCQVNIARLVSQSFEAHGAQEAQGTALGYPLLMDCLVSSDGVTVSQLYEGSGDFRAFLQFDAPNMVGKYPLKTSGTAVHVNIFHTPMSVIDYMSQLFPADPNNSSDILGIDYYGSSDSSAMVNIRSIDPLAGDVQLDGLADESGNLQSFSAGFQCGW